MVPETVYTYGITFFSSVFYILQTIKVWSGRLFLWTNCEGIRNLGYNILETWVWTSLEMKLYFFEVLLNSESTVKKCGMSATICYVEKYFKGALMQIWKSEYLHLKIICWRFHIKTTFTFWDMCMCDMWKICLQTFRNNRTC